MALQEAVNVVRTSLAEQGSEDNLRIFQMASAGDREAIAESREIIQSILEQEMVYLEGKPPQEQAAEMIRRSAWGLGQLEDLYADPTVDEITVLMNGKVFVCRRGKNEPTDLVVDPAEIGRLIEIMIPFNEMGNSASLTQSNSILELVRGDMNRLTAMGPPVIKGRFFVLRKRDTVKKTPESLIALKTIDERAWKALQLLVRGRRNTLISGGTNSGKTTLLEILTGELPANLNVRIIDTDTEADVARLYPDRNIIPLEAHPEAGANMQRLFEGTLRTSPDVIIVAEFRGIGEAIQAIRACLSGHAGSMATTFYSSPEDAIRGIAMMMIDEGMNLTPELAMERVAKAFNVIVQMIASRDRYGVKKIKSITEVQTKGSEIVYRELVRWVPSTSDYMGEGSWAIMNRPSPEMCQSMNEFGVMEEEIRDAFAV